MDVQRFLRDYNIPHVSEGNKHCTEGWINIHCPFCAGSQNFHLGISEEHGAAHCWRCGGHSTIKVISKVLGVSFKKASQINKEYETTGKRRILSPEPKIAINPFKFPQPHENLTQPYKNYLRSRGFNPDKLEKEWGLLQTGIVSFLDGINYSRRILIPIRWNGETVSFQARDITELSDLKYLACPKKREKIHHKHILYGDQETLKRSKAIIIVEGVTDVWRLGKRSVATFGIEFKTEQVLLLSKFNAEFFIIFDEDREAQKQAKKLSVKLKTLGKKAHIISGIKDDPGSMKQDEADNFIKEIFS